MKIPPSYKITPEIRAVVAEIDQLQASLASINIPIDIKKRLRQKSILKSSLFSARIEGNPLTPSDLIHNPDQEKKREVFNILESVSYLDSLKSLDQGITTAIIKDLHRHVVSNLRADGGRFRSEVTAIFNQAGVAVYMPPPPKEVRILVDNLLKYIASPQENSPLIKAFIAHLVFEKIHPFIDGNGRVGRLLIYAVVKYSRYDLGVFIPFEESLDENKEEYYYHLEKGMNETEFYLQFMLGAFLEQCRRIENSISVEMKENNQLNLPLRQEEIYFIIKEHRLVSFDFIRRRFLKVPARTLRYDLKKLAENKHIAKVGKTKGSWYKLLL